MCHSLWEAHNWDHTRKDSRQGRVEILFIFSGISRLAILYGGNYHIDIEICFQMFSSPIRGFANTKSYPGLWTERRLHLPLELNAGLLLTLTRSLNSIWSHLGSYRCFLEDGIASTNRHRICLCFHFSEHTGYPRSQGLWCMFGLLNFEPFHPTPLKQIFKRFCIYSRFINHNQTRFNILILRSMKTNYCAQR